MADEADRFEPDSVLMDHWRQMLGRDLPFPLDKREVFIDALRVAYDTRDGTVTTVVSPLYQHPRNFGRMLADVALNGAHFYRTMTANTVDYETVLAYVMKGLLEGVAENKDEDAQFRATFIDSEGNTTEPNDLTLVEPAGKA